jgi:hypothetical protein
VSPNADWLPTLQHGRHQGKERARQPNLLLHPFKAQCSSHHLYPLQTTIFLDGAPKIKTVLKLMILMLTIVALVSLLPLSLLTMARRLVQRLRLDDGIETAHKDLGKRYDSFTFLSTAFLNHCPVPWCFQQKNFQGGLS